MGEEDGLDLTPVLCASLSLHQVITTKGEELLVDTPSKLPPATERESILEPYVKVEMLSPTEYTGTYFELNMWNLYVDMESDPRALCQGRDA
jgi:GTP-binding protein LepA